MRVRSNEATAAFHNSQWFYIPRPLSAPAMRLFCFPYAGGIGEIYHLWPEGLPANVEVCSLQLPGRPPRLDQLPFTGMAELVDELYQVMHPVLNTPFAFFGHCMGALIAYALTRKLLQKNASLPVRLFLSGRKALHIPALHPPLHQMSLDEFIGVMRLFQIVPDEVLVNTDLLKLFMPALRADFELAEKWAPNLSLPPLPTSIWTFGGADDILATREEMKAWRGYTQNGFKTFILPGDHFFILTPRIRTTILKIIGEALVA